jgi:uncharacterized protein
MKEYILITGASSGIGYEMVQQLAAKKHNLILVARNQAKLEEMQAQLTIKHNISVEYMAKDLSIVTSASEIYEAIREERFLVTALVNNAGVGGYGDFTETSLEDELNMINLNISSLVALTKLFSKEMVLRKSGKIMNVASLLSFIPFPYYSVYSATKAFVLAFSETIAAELEGTGVVVTTLCPGTVETPFHTDKMRKTNAMSANKPVSATVVAEEGVNLLLNGTGKKIVGFNNWVIAHLPNITPDFIMMKIKKNLASQK